MLVMVKSGGSWCSYHLLLWEFITLQRASKDQRCVYVLGKGSGRSKAFSKRLLQYRIKDLTWLTQSLEFCAFSRISLEAKS